VPDPPATVATVKRLTSMFVFVLVAASAWAGAAERAWQTGTWVDSQVVRPKIVFGIGRDPRSGAPPPPVIEVRTYVIETDDVRLELKENTTADARGLDVDIGGPVIFAIEKKTVYVRVGGNTERQLIVTKNIKKAKPTKA
jgi:hypothetical protein